MRLTKSCLLWVWGVVLSVVLPVSSRGAEPSPWQWDDIPRVVAIGDVHGSYDKLLKLLRGSGLVDDQLAMDRR